jgi:hypothetical protein
LAASEAQLAEVEAKIGEDLDPFYRQFLSYADGWPAFFQTVDLFGASDLLGGPRFQHAAEILGFVEDSVLDRAGVRRDDLLPIAASPVDLDLCVMTRRAAMSPGTVIWLAGSEIDRFPSFDDYFAAMVDYNRLELQKLREVATD